MIFFLVFPISWELYCEKAILQFNQMAVYSTTNVMIETQ